MYADDTQLYISFPPTKSHSPRLKLLLSSTLDLIHTWFTNNRLCLNPSKTEYIIIGTPYIQRSKLSSSSISITNKFLEPVNSRNYFWNYFLEI